MLPADHMPAPPPPSQAINLLGGIRVLDMTTSVAGPYAGLLLADMGAEVVKIERPGHGDDARAWGPPFLDGESLWFLSVNRNKQSVTLDTASPAGREALRALVAKTDIILTNQVLRSQKKLGIDFETLKAVNSRLIHVSITGFGLTGPNADLPCYDLIAEGYSGVMDLTGEADGDPQKVGTPAADLLAGQDAAMAALAAIIARSRTGAGQEIDISMVESMTRFLTPRIIPFLGSGELPRRSGGKDSVIAIYQTFDAEDAPLTLGLGNDGIWARFCEAIGRQDMAADPRLANNEGRRRHRPEIVAEIQKTLRTRPRSHWLDLFAKVRVPAGPINRLDEVVQDRAMQERGLLFSLKRNGYAIPQIGLGIRFNGNSHACRTAPPRLGEHTREIFKSWAGWDDARLAALNGKQEQ